MQCIIVITLHVHCDFFECIDKQYYNNVVGQCFFSVWLTIALIMSFLLSDMFIKEPVVQNPYKLVYKVLYHGCNILTNQIDL